MGGFDSGTYRSHKDILDRLSRPQQHSTWVGAQRDWRYSTGVFRHSDNDDSPRDRTIWDKLDYDHYENSHQLLDEELSVSSETLQVEVENEEESGTEDLPESSAPYRTTADTAGLEASSQRRLANRRIVMDEESANLMLPSPPSSSDNPISPSRSRSSRNVHLSDSTDASDNLDSATARLLSENWRDPTGDFDILAVRETLRAPHITPDKLIRSYSWYPGATPVDALLPPGVPLSVKEILVYYPHHIRWQGVMLRLTDNDYRGTDILGVQAFFRGAPQDHMSSSALNQIQRDTVQRLLPDFKTIGYEGKQDADLHTDQLHPGAYLEKKLMSYFLPAFDDLLHGLECLPQGPDVGPLTQCLAWYSSVCNAFTPKLQLNVLHAQALIRALREPQNLTSEHNLNRFALQQWRDVKAFPSTDFPAQMGRSVDGEHSDQQRKGPQLLINAHADPMDLKMQINVPIRHILTFPFLALHGVVVEAFKMGIGRAERRRSLQKSTAVLAKQPDGTQQPSKRFHQSDSDHEAGPLIPKRLCKLKVGAGRVAPCTSGRPTVSPISPCERPRGFESSQPTVSLSDMGSGISKAAPARPWT
ncbi:hypothetical protein E8E13_003865 [Curvularia kusanoi]|uniref:Uncharacterized protein n=1 Tax=Curvularia kusanoi TaxID=90978 RepID=A0A9P4TAC5_CURKU|nr:hypothetical protein E8E13_003865 [Curvularia kusanoi]